MTPPRTCPRCGRKPVSSRSTKYCFDCRPKKRRPPPPCRRCGSLDYYSAGLCQRCHAGAPDLPASCPDCFAWGLLRGHAGLCPACRTWRRGSPGQAACRVCGRHLYVNANGACRLCVSQAKLRRKQERRITVEQANRDGQQLFLANLDHSVRLPPTRPPTLASTAPTSPRPALHALIGPHRYEQTRLLDVPRDLTAGLRHGFPPPPDEDLAAAIEALAVDHAARNGWHYAKAHKTRRALRVLLGLQDHPGTPIRASQVSMLYAVHLPVEPTLEILTVAGLLDDDRVPPLVTWFERQITGLPPQVAAELRVWFDVARHGSTTPPRFRPRPDRTIRAIVGKAMPALQRWAGKHQSLREISRQEVLDGLPAGVNARYDQLQGLRPIFTVLKARKLVFGNPTNGIRGGIPQPQVPVAARIDQVVDALDSDEPARAGIVALVAFHALRSGQVRHLHLTDLHDGRLHIDGRVILLADPVQTRLTNWLDYRQRNWPDSTNPYLFINQYTASRHSPVSHVWTNQTAGTSLAAIREDRILHEATATTGDARRVCDLFGINVNAALRYTAATLDPAGIREVTQRAGGVSCKE
jgi:hypothetical protein